MRSASTVFTAYPPKPAHFGAELLPDPFFESGGQTRNRTEDTSVRFFLF